MIHLLRPALMCLFFICACTAQRSFAQVNKDQLGAWYMYFWNTSFKKSSFGLQGDYQFRNWNVMGDLEQLLLRSGVTYQPKNTPVKFTLGYAYVLSGTAGPSAATTSENRIYQEALINQKIGNLVYLLHRFRFEQRFVQRQDFRTRYRYNLFVNVPLNKTVIEKGTVYVAAYNEAFLNGQRNIGNGKTVEIFDRNRTYGALGYGLLNNLNLQLGVMRQATDSYAKDQLQLSLHHKW